MADTKEMLNERQLAALLGQEPNKLVIAPPGAGKTKLLISAIAEYRKLHPTSKINAITYTKAATKEMLERLSALGVTDVAVRTIHSWAFDRLKILAEIYHFKIEIMDNNHIMKILKTLITNSKKKVNPDILFSFVHGNRKMEVTESYRKSLAFLEKKYIDYKRINNLYDFSDFPLYLLKKLNDFNECILDIDALFVDEFQDVDPEQLKIFDLVVSDLKFVIGDKKQSIYAFRGADSKVFTKLKNFTTYNLNINYRSYQRIMNYADSVYSRISPKLPNQKGYYISSVLTSERSEVTCNRGEGGKLIISNPFGATLCNGESTILSVDIREMLEDDAMILCRTNKEVSSFIEAGYSNVSTIHQSKGLEYKNVILVDNLIRDEEDLNVAYVGLTRAKDNLMIVSFGFLLKAVRNFKWAKLG